MKASVENALYHCGRDRVMQRDFGGRPAVAIRWDRKHDVLVTNPDGADLYLVREADTIDDAGGLAALAFAARLRVAAKDLNDQAARIERALDGGAK